MKPYINPRTIRWMKQQKQKKWAFDLVLDRRGRIRKPSKFRTDHRSWLEKHQ